MKPLDLLEAKLMSFQIDLAKSKKALDEGGITYQMHEIHKNNISPKIAEYKNAIQILRDNTKIK